MKVKARLSNPLPKTQAVKGGMCGGFRIGHGNGGATSNFGGLFVYLLIYLFEFDLCITVREAFSFCHLTSCYLQEGGLGGEDSPFTVQISNGIGVSIKVDVVKLVEWVFRINMIIHILSFMGGNLLDEVICCSLSCF